MPSTQEFRRRIKSVNNTKQITRAMEMVASVKMQKAVKTNHGARDYIKNSWEMLHTLAGLVSPESHKLLDVRPIKKTLLVVVTSDRGLAGSFNSDIVRKATAFVRGEITIGEHVVENDYKDVIMVGKKGYPVVKSLKNGKLIAEFANLGSEIDFEEVSPVANLLLRGYKDKTYDRVVIVYSHFESTLKQTAVAQQLLPITSENLDLPELWKKTSIPINANTSFEPNPDIILDRILEQFIRVQLFGAVLESNASEQSARMMAMNNATTNAKNLIEELQLVYNSVRQDSITREIAEIAGATEAMR